MKNPKNINVEFYVRNNTRKPAFLKTNKCPSIFQQVAPTFSLFSIDCLGLACCSAFSCTTGIRKSISIAKLILSYYFKIDYLIDPSLNNFALNQNLDYLRDFSKTSSIGELGQGITYYFFTQILDKYCVITDNVSHTGFSKKTPDYLVKSLQTKRKYLLEVKATIRKSHIFSRAKTAFNQLGNNTGYVSIVSYSQNNGATTLSLFDPPVDQFIPNFDDLLERYEHELGFTFMDKNHPTKTIELLQKEFVIYDEESVSFSNGFSYTIQLGLFKELIDYLMNSKSEEILSILKNMPHPEEEIQDKENISFFKNDIGIVVILKKENFVAKNF